MKVLDAALFQLPIDPVAAEVICRTDTAGCSHDLVNAARTRGVLFICGHSLTTELAKVILSAAENRWQTTISADGTEEREVKTVAEITDLVDLSNWPGHTRMLVRSKEPHLGAEVAFTDVDGHRYQVLITDHPPEDICLLEALYRGRGRCQCAIRDAKDIGLSHFSSQSFAINQAWLAVVLVAGDLLAWTKGLCLEGDLERAEPKHLRSTLLHSAGTLWHSARQTTLRLGEGWPWADQLVTAPGRLPRWQITVT